MSSFLSQSFNVTPRSVSPLLIKFLLIYPLKTQLKSTYATVTHLQVLAWHWLNTFLLQSKEIFTFLNILLSIVNVLHAVHMCCSIFYFLASHPTTYYLSKVFMDIGWSSLYILIFFLVNDNFGFLFIQLQIYFSWFVFYSLIIFCSSSELIYMSTTLSAYFR